jgi:hypothetical protein
LDPNEVRGEVSRLARLIDNSEDPKEWNNHIKELIPWLIAFWDVHPHSAMEMLEFTTMRLPIPLAHAFVRKVVLGWRKKDTYNPNAGGGAGHCFLSALILSENFDLAEDALLDKELTYTLDKELNYSRFDRMRDGERKEAIVRSIAASTGRTDQDD